MIAILSDSLSSLVAFSPNDFAHIRHNVFLFFMQRYTPPLKCGLRRSNLRCAAPLAQLEIGSEPNGSIGLTILPPTNPPPPPPPRSPRPKPLLDLTDDVVADDGICPDLKLRLKADFILWKMLGCDVVGACLLYTSDAADE